jgi:diguanylate cyclase (GGDEF)-like protein
VSRAVRRPEPASRDSLIHQNTRLRRTVAQLNRELAAARFAATHDPLTGLLNRPGLEALWPTLEPRGVLLIDLDGFKEYNDTYGHIAGDKLLKSLAGMIEESLRTIDIAARFGGDEFVAIFPQTPKVDAIQITNRLKEKIDRDLGRYHGEMPLTVSMGLATYPDDASSIMELIEKTDQALYLAKKGGGNRVVYL